MRELINLSKFLKFHYCLRHKLHFIGWTFVRLCSYASDFELQSGMKFGFLLLNKLKRRKSQLTTTRRFEE